MSPFTMRRNNFANHLCTFYGGSTYGYVTIVVYQQTLSQIQQLAPAFGVLNVVYKQLFAIFSLELLTVNFYNCVHFNGLNGFFHEADAVVASLF